MSVFTTVLGAVIPRIWQPITKAIIGGGTTAITSIGAVNAVDSELTLVGHIVVGALNGAITFATIYFAPANRPS